MYVAIALVAVFAVVISAGAAVSGIVNNYYGDTTVNQAGSDSEMLGARQSDIATGFWDVYVENDLTVDGATIMNGSVSFTGAATLTGDIGLTGTTTMGRPDATFQIALDFTNATGTGNVAVKDTQAILGSAQNTNGRMLCNMAAIDVKTANGLYNMDLQLGIGATNTSSATLIAATTVSTSTADILNKDDDEGSTTDEVYAIASGEYFTVTRTTQSINATSSASWTVAGGMLSTGTAHVNCWNAD